MHSFMYEIKHNETAKHIKSLSLAVSGLLQGYIQKSCGDKANRSRSFSIDILFY